MVAIRFARFGRLEAASCAIWARVSQPLLRVWAISRTRTDTQSIIPFMEQILYKLRQSAAGSLLAVLILLAGCGSATAPAVSAVSASASAKTPAPAAVPSSAPQELLDGAKKEGQLTLLFNQQLTSSANEFPTWTAAFNKRYSLDLKVDYTSGPSMPQMAAKIAQEYQANRTASSDLWLGDTLSAFGLMQVDALQTVDWSWSPDLKNPKLLAEDGKLVEFEWQFPGISINTDQLKGDTVPKSLADLLDPKLKSRVASTPYAAQFDVLATPDVWGEQKAIDYATKLSSQVGGLISCGDIDRVATGEFSAFGIDCGAQYVDQAKVKGAHLAHVIPTDAAMYYPLYMAIPKNAAHPNAAKLWAAFIDSQEGQLLLYKLSLNDHPLIPGSQSAGEYQRLLKAGVTFVGADVAFRKKNDPAKMTKLNTQFVNILTKK